MKSHTILNCFTLVIFIILSTYNLKAQISFTNESDLLINSSTRSTIPVGVADMNGDFLDDIIQLHRGNELFIAYQRADGTSFDVADLGTTSNEAEWSMCIADVDNNGFNDILAGGRYNKIKMLMASDDGTDYDMSNLDGIDIFLQGSNFVDINNDGWLDAFGCHDDGTSRIWGNNGSGTLNDTEDTWIDMSLFPGVESNAGNYGSLWIDIDNDDDLDLYIAKCRTAAEGDTSDVRRKNQLWINDGSGGFSEKAAERGLKINWQTWTSEFQDIDNDGDLDCFLTNHDYTAQLLINDGAGYFTDITNSSGIDIEGFPIQALLRDFDNDGFVDIVVTGSEEHLYLNNQNNTFSQVENLFEHTGNDEMYSFSVGDLNHDGFLDIYGGYASGFTTVSFEQDKLWMNDGNNNNFFAVNLVGNQSNRNGIGARLTIYGDWGIQIREIRAGESYGVASTFTSHFGIGTATEIDSLKVHWPSGIIDVIESPNPNEFLTVYENNCLPTAVELTLNGSTTVCPGDSTIMTAPIADNYSWSTGETTQSIVVNEEGIYNLTLVDENGCIARSQNIEVLYSPDETPSIEANGELVFCQGGSVTLSSTLANGYTWSNGAMDASIEVENTGSYSVTTIGECGMFTSSIIEVEVLDAPIPVVMGDSISVGELANLSANGTNPQWYDAPMGGNLLATGASFETEALTETTTFYVEDNITYDGGVFNAGKLDNTGNGGENSQNFNGSLIFESYEEFTIKFATVYAFGAGERVVQLINVDNGEVLLTKTIPMVDGENRIQLNFAIPANGNYEIGCPDDPSLFRNNDGVDINYPYDLDGLGAITTSTFGDPFYYYFYDWEIEGKSVECISERVPVTVIVEIVNSTTNINYSDAIKLYPNPTSQEVTIEINRSNNMDWRLQITDLQGRVIKAMEITTAGSQEKVQLDIQDIPTGIYFIHLKNGEDQFYGKLVKE